MKGKPGLNERVQGCLIGAAIGAELGFARCVEPDRFAIDTPAGMFGVELGPVRDYQPRPHGTAICGAGPLVDVGVRAYLERAGRATPEDFGRVFRDDEGIAMPAFFWDGLHTIQEILREGMQPRISGFGACPSGLLCASMPAVGIYHFAYPEYAYLDGVELASVAQPRLGADWAGLCAAAIAAAFGPDMNGAAIVEAVMKIAFQNNRDLFYELDWSLRRGSQRTEEEFLAYWSMSGGTSEPTKDTVWIACNPVQYLLPLLRRYADAPDKFMAALVVPPAPRYVQTVTGVLGGALLGALHGPAAFPDAWRAWAAPVAEPWFGLADVVQVRVKAESAVITVTEGLAETKAGDISLLQEKIRGCILAGAIGNAMGSPVEGRFFQEIDEQYPEHVTTVLDPARLEGEDDNQMAMLLVETYLAREGLPVVARHFGKTWQERLNRDHFFPFCMGHSYDLICKGWDPRIIGHWSWVTGSTVMCMEPVGVYHAGDTEFAAIDATAVSYMYQRGLDMVAATMLAATVAEAFRPEATVDSICGAALDVAPTEELKTFDRRPFRSCHEYLLACMEVAAKYDDVLEARAELYEKCLLYHCIDPLELWGLTLAMFKIADGDVRQTAIGGTNIGRDSDTIAGRGAMLAGILRGAKNVPQEWIDLFRPEALDGIYRNADRLADLVLNKKLAFLKKRRQAGA